MNKTRAAAPADDDGKRATMDGPPRRDPADEDGGSSGGDGDDGGGSASPAAGDEHDDDNDNQDDDDSVAVAWCGEPLCTIGTDTYYQAYECDGEAFSVGDCVHVNVADDTGIWVSAIECLWEDQYGETWFEGRWFYEPRNTYGCSIRVASGLARGGADVKAPSSSSSSSSSSSAASSSPSGISSNMSSPSS